jgi:hypothetical protein
MPISLRFLLLCLLTALLSACATTTPNDPLRYSKKLIKEGHVDLYNNGAFRVPHTELTLIPAGPDALELVGELAGIRARQSFVTAVKRAADSVYIVSEGTQLTYHFAGHLHAGTDKLSSAIHSQARAGSTLLFDRSTELSKEVIGKSWQFSKDLYNYKEEFGEGVGGGIKQVGDVIAAQGSEQGRNFSHESLATAKEISAASCERSAAALSYAGRSFVVGYATIPARLKERKADLGDNLDAINPVSIGKDENSWREKWSDKSVDLLSSTVGDYCANIAESFHKAGAELKSANRTTGVSLATLKSLRWVLKGMFWDTVIEPTANVSAAALGYVAVNAVAYPTMILVREGVATTSLALEVTWDAACTGYDIVAPTATAAIAGVYSLVDFSGSHLAAGSSAIAGPALGYSVAGVSQAVGVTVKGAGAAAGKSVQYVGVPLLAAGVAVSGGTIGSAVTVGGTISSGTLFVTGEGAAATTYACGNLLAGTTLVGGTVAATGAGAASGVYELSKAVAVPAGYELGSGIVLSYGTLTHLGAHSILAVSDASYMVLSLEGPRWVLYAVSGKLGDGAELPTGAVLDLKQMQDEGEELKYLPVSDGEMQAVVDSVYENLPVSN